MRKRRLLKYLILFLFYNIFFLSNVKGAQPPPLFEFIFHYDDTNTSYPTDSSSYNWSSKIYNFGSATQSHDIQSNSGWTTNSIMGKGALNFDGVDDIHIIPSLGILTNTEGPLTIEMWVNLRIKNRWNGLIFKENSYIIRISTNNRVYGYVGNGIGGYWEVVSSSLISTNKWYNIALSWDTNNIVLYINGNKESQITVNGRTKVNTNRIYIGEDLYTSGYLAGKLDEVKIIGDRKRFYNLSGNEYYVQTNGNNTNCGLWWGTNYAWKTISYAASNLSPGDIVYVGDGIYTQQVDIISNGLSDKKMIKFFATNRAILDMKGNSLFGYNIDSKNWISIKNFICKRAERIGVFIKDSSHISISNLKCYVNGNGVIPNEGGIWITNSTKVKIDNCRIYNNTSLFQDGGRGIAIIDSSSNIIINNNIYSNTFYGILLEGRSKRNNIFNNIIWGTQQNGIYIDNRSSYNKILSNSIYHRQENGIWIRGKQTKHNEIIGNCIYSNSLTGILIGGYANEKGCSNIIAHNYIFGNHPYNISIINPGFGNVIFSNICGEKGTENDYGILLEGCTNTKIIDNICKYNRLKGICLYGGNFINKNNIIKNNFIFSNSLLFSFDIFCAGISIYSSCSNNIISSNKICFNYYDGISINNQCGSNIIKYNIINNNSYNGINFKTTGSDRVERNKIFKNINSGIRIDNGRFIKIKNNTICSNGNFGVIITNTCNIDVFRNNIIVWNNSIGLKVIGSSVSNNWNDIYGNNGNLTNSSTLDGDGNYLGCSGGVNSLSPSRNPFFITTEYTNINFLNLYNNSPCIDNGCPLDSPYNGLAIDIGAVETLYNCLTIKKSVYSITCSNISFKLVPGVTITYKIEYRSGNGVSLTNPIIYDRLDPNIMYFSNSVSNSPGWIVEFSTNVLPNQDYSSTQYTTSQNNYTHIKWIRWKRPLLAGGQNGVLFFKVILR